MILTLSIGLVVAVLLYVLLIRTRDLPFVEPESPTGHLDERKAAIYENIRDANFEFLMGKLSQQDYQQTKADLQQELNEVNAEIRSVLAQLAPQPSVASGASKAVGPAPDQSGKPVGKATEGTHANAAGTEASLLVASMEEAPGQQEGPHVTSAVHPGHFVCGHCGASFAQPMRFCGACGRPMGEARA